MGEGHSLGKRGEELAIRYLKRKGFKILERNFYTRWGEIDIVAQKNKRLHFVEVRTVSKRGLLDPRESLTTKKRNHLWKALHIYLKERGWDGDFSVALIAIQWDEKSPRLQYIQDILEGYWE